ncbi:hypothetical protein, conserved in T. vivax, partial [Trypanosoma vivax Y486]
MLLNAGFGMCAALFISAHADTRLASCALHFCPVLWLCTAASLRRVCRLAFGVCLARLFSAPSVLPALIDAMLFRCACVLCHFVSECFCDPICHRHFGFVFRSVHCEPSAHHLRLCGHCLLECVFAGSCCNTQLGEDLLHPRLVFDVGDLFLSLVVCHYYLDVVAGSGVHCPESASVALRACAASGVEQHGVACAFPRRQVTVGVRGFSAVNDCAAVPPPVEKCHDAALYACLRLLERVNGHLLVFLAAEALLELACSQCAKRDLER